MLHEAVFLAPNCPARGCRVKGGSADRRFAQTLDPSATHKDSAAARRFGQVWTTGSKVGLASSATSAVATHLFQVYAVFAYHSWRSAPGRRDLL